MVRTVPEDGHAWEQGAQSRRGGSIVSQHREEQDCHEKEHSLRARPGLKNYFTMPPHSSQARLLVNLLDVQYNDNSILCAWSGELPVVSPVFIDATPSIDHHPIVVDILHARYNGGGGGGGGKRPLDL